MFKFLILLLSIFIPTIYKQDQGNCGDLYYKKIASPYKTKYLVLDISSFSKNGDTIFLKNNKEIKIEIFHRKEYQPNYCSDIVLIDDSIQKENLYCKRGILIIKKKGDSIKIELVKCIFKNSKNRISIKNEVIKAKLRTNNG